jgi:hypothetical protein
METREAITLCQPDSLKACCACCGLFNYKNISRDNLEWRLLNAPASISTDEVFDDKPQKHQHDIRDVTSHICRYQGFISGNRPGCTLHPLVRGTDARNTSLYGSRICQEYLCPAHAILSEQLKDLLISSISSWYEYSLAIIDPDSFIWIVNEAGTRFGVNVQDGRCSSFNDIILKCLSLHGSYLSRIESPIFHYSLAEYNQYKSSFTIAGNAGEQREMRGILDGLL